METCVDDLLATHGTYSFLMRTVVAVVHVQLNLGLAELAYAVARHPR